MNFSIKHLTLMTALVTSMGLTACKTEVHDVQWYLDHSDELSKKLDACKTNPDAANDAECKAATEAFMRWYAASGQASQQDASTQGVDARLEPPQPDGSAAPTDPNAAPAPAAAEPQPTDEDNTQPQPAQPAQGH